MKEISKNAKLSKIYTNHSIRHSVVDVLDDNNFKARDIMWHTGHKSEASIRQYTSKCPPTKRRQMSVCLEKSLAPDETAETPIVNDGNEKPTVSSPKHNAIVPIINDTDWLEIDLNDITINWSTY